MKRNPLFLLLLLTAAVVFLPAKSFSQRPPAAAVDSPIDGGLTLLLAAGAAYGMKKVRDGRKQKEAGKEN